MEEKSLTRFTRDLVDHVLEFDATIGKTPIPFSVSVTGEIETHEPSTIRSFNDAPSALVYLLQDQICGYHRVVVTHQVAEEFVDPGVALLILPSGFVLEHALDSSQVEDCSSEALTSALPLHSLLVTKR